MMDPQIADDCRDEKVADLLEQAGLRGEFDLIPLEGGANNKVFRVDLPETRLLYKEYFKHPDDPRNRLRNEFSFIHFAWHNGIRALPMPLAQDPEGHCALFQFIPGRKLEPREVTRDRAQEALRFFQQVNEFKDQTDADMIPQASEACYTTADHCACVERRLARLEKIEHASDLDKDAATLVRTHLLPMWKEIRTNVTKQCRRLKTAEDVPLIQKDHCLSPSDFGFHNALLTPEGAVKFIDFEYAGWDDPAKTVCDFFCQPEKPVPNANFEMFARGVASDLSAPEMHLERFRLLLPVYRMKWCCIMLNDFLPAGASRRQFAKGEASCIERKQTQLAKARRALDDLQNASRLAG